MSDSIGRELDPDWWWIQLSMALRRGRTADADAARRRLAELGIEVQLTDEAVLRAREGRS